MNGHDFSGRVQSGKATKFPRNHSQMWRKKTRLKKTILWSFFGPRIKQRHRTDAASKQRNNDFHADNVDDEQDEQVAEYVAGEHERVTHRTQSTHPIGGIQKLHKTLKK